MASFYFDGDRRRIYEVPTNFNLTIDSSGFRIYTPSSGLEESFVVLNLQRDLWSRFQDWFTFNQWSTIPIFRSGGALRGQDSLGNDVFDTVSFTLNAAEDWRLVLADYPHELTLQGNLFSNSSGILFDYDRIVSTGVYPRIEGADSLLTYNVNTGTGGSVGNATEAKQDLILSGISNLNSQVLLIDEIRKLLGLYPGISVVHTETGININNGEIVIQIASDPGVSRTVNRS